MHIETRDHRLAAAELKFLVAPAVGEAIRTWGRNHLTADPHGGGAHADQYSTTTLYTDTPARDVYERRDSYGRSKYRVRRYGAADVAFLERKLRTQSLLSKRRSIVPLAELPHLDGSGTDLSGWPGEWFAGRLSARRLSPICQVAYTRTARVTATPYGLARLTIDTGLSARPATGWMFQPCEYRPVLTDHSIVELKFLVAMPAVFKHLLEAFGLIPTRVSKYRLSAEALGLVAVPGVVEVA